MNFNCKNTEQNSDKFTRAKKRIEDLKGFYGHLSVYLVVNAAILLVIYLSASKNGESFWQAGHFFTPIFWGLGVLIHAIFTFKLNLFFGKKWEERQIRKYMEQDRRESEKYR